MTGRTISLLILSLCLLTPAFGQQVSGQVFFRDSTLTEARYIMVYVKESRTAAMTDGDGRYALAIPQDKGDSIHVEFSHIGCRSVELAFCTRNGDIEAEPVTLEMQPLMIATAYVTPKGKTPAEYILSQVWKRAEENRKRFRDYGAAVTYRLASNEAPAIAEIMPWTMLAAGKLFATTSGFGPISRFCLKHDHVDIQAKLNRHVINGTTADRDNTIVSSNVELDPKTEENFKGFFSHFDLFNLLYGYQGSWIRGFTKHNEFELTGTYEYGDKLVDILHWSSGGRLNVTVHVVEEDWGILKVQVNFGPEGMRCEARDIGNGVYMPVTLTVSPNITSIPPERIPRAIAFVKRMKSINRKTKERTVKLLESHMQDGFHPYMIVGFNIRYDINQ